MQTFIPIASVDFHESAQVLDNKRLHKQSLEGWQIMMVLLELDPAGEHRKPKGWLNHPAVKMWRGSEALLYAYVMAMTNEWKSRGYQSTIDTKASNTIKRAVQLGLVGMESAIPSWMQDSTMFQDIASTHRQALLVKNYEWYSQFNWPEDTGTEPTEYEYLWSEPNVYN